MFRCSGVPVFRGVPWRSGLFRAVPVFRCSGVPVFRCSGVPECSGVFRAVPVFLVLVHASVSCKLSRAVKFKSFILKIRFLLKAALPSCLNWLGGKIVNF